MGISDGAFDLVFAILSKSIPEYFGYTFEEPESDIKKRKILQHWPSFEGFNLRNSPLGRVVVEYQRTKDWLKAYLVIPAELREIYLSAYQSYLWNECVKEIWRKKLTRTNLYPIKYNAGNLMFFRKMSHKEKDSVPGTFPTISHKMDLTEEEQGIVNKVLVKEVATLSDFDVQDGLGNFFKTHQREVIVHPQNFEILPPQVDELNDNGRGNTFKIKLSFFLPKGSYATIVTKRLFNA